MPEGIAVDNDILIKLICYGVADEAFGLLRRRSAWLGVLGVARFVVKRRLEKDKRIANGSAAARAFEALLQHVVTLEPEDIELRLAADLEEEAARSGLELDPGECQLAAIVMVRGLPALLTGDKRAIRALGTIRTGPLTDRVICLEQLVAALLARTGSEALRAAICAEPRIDLALSTCFSCSSGLTLTDQALQVALASYCSDLRRDAGGVLITETTLAALTA